MYLKRTDWLHMSALPLKIDPDWAGGIVYFDGLIQDSGGRLNKKDGLTRYGDIHVKDKTS